MKKFRTIVSLIAMVLAGVVGFFLGSALESAFGGAILFSLIVGIASHNRSMLVGSYESNSWKDKTIQKKITLGCDNAIKYV